MCPQLRTKSGGSARHEKQVLDEKVTFQNSRSFLRACKWPLTTDGLGSCDAAAKLFRRDIDPLEWLTIARMKLSQDSSLNGV